MADTPAPSGGSGWGIVEIVVVGLIALTLFVNLFNNGSAPWRPFETTDPVDTTNLADSNSNTIGDCVISLTSPIKNKKITNIVILVQGTFSGCNLNDPNIALYGQVVQSNGTVISPYMPISGTINNTFEGNVILSKKVTTKTGELILIPNITQDGNTTHTLRVPLTFSIK